MAGMSAYDPALYELIHRGTPGDLAFYTRSVSTMGRVLELGCGYGRILRAIAVASPRVELTGLDIDAGLLLRARERLPQRVRLIEGDMARFETDERFDGIIVPYSGLWCLSSREEVSACLERVYAHLVPGGRFLFDAYAADGFHGEGGPEEEEAFLAEVYEGSRGFRVFENVRWRPEEQGFTVRYRHEPLHSEDVTIEASIEHYYLLAHQVQALLGKAGFEDIRLSSGFQGQPWSDEASQLIGEARRPESGPLACGRRA